MKHEVGQVLVSSSSSAVLLDTYFVFRRRILESYIMASLPTRSFGFITKTWSLYFVMLSQDQIFCREIKIDAICDVSSLQTRRGCLPHPFFHLCLDGFYGRHISFFFLLCFLFYGIDDFIVPVGFSAGNIATAQIWCCAVSIIVIPALLPLLSGDADFGGPPTVILLPHDPRGPSFDIRPVPLEASPSLSFTYYPSSFSLIVLWSLPVYSRHLF